MKKLAKRLVIVVLGWQVRRLRQNNEFEVVAVAGSVGKTSTKLAIAKILSQKYKVQFQDGNYNDPVSVPLIFFGQKLPSLFNPLAWLKVFIKNERLLRSKYPYDYVVLELGSDTPGDLNKFKKYLRVDVGVLSAITPEHMEYFKNLDTVAEEETQIANISSLTLVNKDMCPAKYVKDLPNSLTYAISQPADFTMQNLNFKADGCDFEVRAGNSLIFNGSHESFAEPLLYAVLAAIAVAHKAGLGESEIEAGLASIKPAPGRLQILNGINNSRIIDDTYNASPAAAKAALDTLYRMPAPQKIAILGNMNELGDYSAGEHRAIGDYCDPKQLNLVVTIGPDANKYLAQAAKANGCRVESFDSPYDAGNFVKKQIQKGSLVLAKGSQNKVFAEEAVKQILATRADAKQLVRQSPDWLATKQKAFKEA